MSNAEQRRLQEADSGGVPWAPEPEESQSAEPQPAEPQSAEEPQ